MLPKANVVSFAFKNQWFLRVIEFLSSVSHSRWEHSAWLEQVIDWTIQNVSKIENRVMTAEDEKLVPWERVVIGPSGTGIHGYRSYSGSDFYILAHKQKEDKFGTIVPSGPSDYGKPIEAVLKTMRSDGYTIDAVVWVTTVGIVARCKDNVIQVLIYPEPA